MRIFRLITCAALAGLVAGCAGLATKEESAELRKKTDELRQNLTDSNSRLEEISNKFSLLREKVEEQRSMIERLSSSPPAVPEGLRVVTLGGTGAKDVAGEAAPKRIQRPQGPPAKADVKTAAAPEVKSEGLIEQNRGALKAEAAAQGKDALTDQVAMYNRGQDLFMAGKLGEAREVFSEFVKRFPSSALADNAFYWIGESYYSERDFEKALEKFRQTADLYPDENKAPDALLKAGLTLMEMNEPDKAKQEFDALKARYPDSEAAVKAKKTLTKDSGRARKK
ncbi:MAG: tol-pal system protein YbgF [Deltaproteobacteria bacterium]|nr:tol-pal system protein YbgF [Deltaproteobacteria bacterium]